MTKRIHRGSEVYDHPWYRRHRKVEGDQSDPGHRGNGELQWISLQALNERFYPSMLQGMLLNACADISSDALMQVDNIKKATGEDVVICERKGRDRFRSGRMQSDLLGEQDPVESG